MNRQQITKHGDLTFTSDGRIVFDNFHFQLNGNVLDIAQVIEEHLKMCGVTVEYPFSLKKTCDY